MIDEFSLYERKRRERQQPTSKKTAADDVKAVERQRLLGE